MNVYEKLGLILAIVLLTSSIPVINGDAVDTIANLASKIPESGTLAKAILSVVDVLNAIIGRLLGGAPPCTISINRGLWCSGVARSGGAAEFLEGSLDAIPPLVLPGPVKEMIKKLLPLMYPFADVIFGGNKIQNEA